MVSPYLLHRRKAFRGGDAPWTPADITTILWLKEEGTEGSWTDHSGNSNHATQVTETSQPSLTNTLNGLTVRTFDGSDDYLETPSLTLNTATSLFVVFRTETLAGDRTVINQQYGDVVRPWQHYFSSLGRLVDWRTGAYIPSITAGNYFILSEVQSSTNLGGVMMWRDGNDGVASTSSISFFADSKAMSIGRAQSFGVIGWMQGRIAEIVLVGSAVDVSTRQKIEGYLAHKWGLTTNLPSGHPHKTDPPTA
jgi:hypothetical protein